MLYHQRHLGNPLYFKYNFCWETTKRKENTTGILLKPKEITSLKNITFEEKHLLLCPFSNFFFQYYHQHVRSTCWNKWIWQGALRTEFVIYFHNISVYIGIIDLQSSHVENDPSLFFFLIPKKKRPTTNSCMLIKKLLSNKLLLSPTNVLQHEQRHRWGHSDWWNEALPSPKRPGRRGSHLVWSWHLMGYVTGVILEKSARRCTWWEGWEDGPHGMAAPRALYLTAK